jgi:hypothetical protein
LDKVGGAIEGAKKRGGRALNTVKNFGAGFGGQFLDNQAHTPVQDAINPKAGEARKEWLERESQNSGAFDAGRKAADVVNILQGAGQIGIGGTATVGGTIVSGTGAGAAVGAPTAVGGAVVAGHGAGTAQRAIRSLISKGRRGNGQSSGRRDLDDHERSGGHTMDRHVGKSEAWLQKRAQAEGKDVVSSFNNEAAANRTQGSFVKKYKADIETWVKSDSKDLFVREIEMKQPIGHWVRNGVKGTNSTNRATVVLVKDNSAQGYYIRTAYPIP